jgi:hypothetical protein
LCRHLRCGMRAVSQQLDSARHPRGPGAGMCLASTSLLYSATTPPRHITTQHTSHQCSVGPVSQPPARLPLTAGPEYMSAYPSSYPPPYDYYSAPPPSSYDYYGRGPPPGYGPPSYPSSHASYPHSYPSSYYPSRDPYGYNSGPPPDYYGGPRCAAHALACCQACCMCSHKACCTLAAASSTQAAPDGLVLAVSAKRLTPAALHCTDCTKGPSPHSHLTYSAAARADTAALRPHIAACLPRTAAWPTPPRAC